jgi:hypothetical protein
MKYAYNNYEGKSEAKQPLVNPSRRWKDLRNIKININERQMKVGLNSGSSEQNAVAGTCEKGNEPPSSSKGSEFIDQLSH